MTQAPFLNGPESDDPTWYNGVNHVLATWDEHHVAAIFSDASVSSWGGGAVRMITSDPVAGTVTLGPKTMYYDETPPEIGMRRVSQTVSYGSKDVSLFAYYVNQDTGEPEGVTDYGYASGGDATPGMVAANMVVPAGTPLSSDDTDTFVRVDQTGFNAAMHQKVPGFEADERFSIGLKARQDAPFNIPSDASGIRGFFTIVYRSDYEASHGLTLDIYADPGDDGYRPSAFGAYSTTVKDTFDHPNGFWTGDGEWHREVPDSEGGFSWSGDTAVMAQQLANRKSVIRVSMGSAYAAPTGINDIAYLAMTISWDEPDGTIGGGPGDPESTYATIDLQRVGDLLVAHHTDTGRTFTFTYDAATDTFTKKNVQRFLWGVPNEEFERNYGARIVPWIGNTMLMARSFYISPFVIGSDTTGHGMARFFQWNGSSWDLGPVTEIAHRFGGDDYMNCVRILDGTRVTALTEISRNIVHPPGDNPYWLLDVWYYAVITGAYPNAPTIVETQQHVTGTQFYFEFEWFTTPDYSQIYRAVPVQPGTVTPIDGGSDLFDWAMQPVTVKNGVIIEGTLTSIGPTDSWYDIAIAVTADKHVWAHWTLPGTSNRGANGSIGLRDVSDPTAQTIVLNDPFDGGVYTSDYSRRTIAAAGNRVVITWMTRDGFILPVAAYGPLGEIIPIPVIDPNLLAELRDIGQSWGGSPW